jgi:GT2 family glycosyltransferase
MFSIIIPSWNNLSFLKLCIRGIEKNSAFKHQVIVHVNDGSDGTLSWIREKGIEYTVSAENIGICKAVNLATGLVNMPYVVYMNDDMYCLPGWDEEIIAEIKKAGTENFMFSATMIEPYYTGNKCVIVSDFGRDVNSFSEEKLLEKAPLLMKEDWYGSTWPPTVVSTEIWKNVGAYSEEFSPGMASDDDFAMKMWQQGCRIYKGIGKSKVYHFISKSTGRIVKNDGRKQFLQKWGIKQSTFHKYYILRGEPYRGTLSNPSASIGLYFQKCVSFVKRLAS